MIPTQSVIFVKASDFAAQNPIASEVWENSDASNFNDVTWGDASYTLVTLEKFEEMLCTALLHKHGFKHNEKMKSELEAIRGIFEDIPNNIYIDLEGK